MKKYNVKTHIKDDEVVCASQMCTNCPFDSTYKCKKATLIIENKKNKNTEEPKLLKRLLERILGIKKLEVEVVLLDENVKLPKYETDGACGFDLSSNEETYVLEPGETHATCTGIKVAIYDGLGFVMARSGLSTKNGINLANGVGLVDMDYRGEVKVALKNTSNTPFTVEKGMRIAQFVILPFEQVDMLHVPELDETERGEGGFNSTGLK